MDKQLLNDDLKYFDNEVIESTPEKSPGLLVKT